jgi:hypothetical protein
MPKGNVEVARRLSRMEALLIEMRHEQDVQLKRSTALQAQLDALTEHVSVNLTKIRLSLREKRRGPRTDSATRRLADIVGPEMPADATEKPCPKKGCDGTLMFQAKTPIPGTGGRGKGANTEFATAPGWLCPSCLHIEWIFPVTS